MRDVQAIPTSFAGVMFRSRLEAQCAYMMTLFGWEWQYEPESLMLSNGVIYRPDFHVLVADRLCTVECRGYHSEKGADQIQGYAQEYVNRGFSQYAVIGPDSLIVHSFGSNSCGGGLDSCDLCGLKSFWDGNQPGCARGCDGFLTGIKFELKSGRIFLNGFSSEQWSANL